MCVSPSVKIEPAFITFGGISPAICCCVLLSTKGAVRLFSSFRRFLPTRASSSLQFLSLLLTMLSEKLSLKLLGVPRQPG